MASMMDFEELDRAEGTTWSCWNDFLDRVAVYALTMPNRAEHIEELLAKWQFADARIYFGMLRESVRLEQWSKAGRVALNEHVNVGRVACHFGHRAIMKDFLEMAPPSKRFVLIFEDDLVETPTEDSRIKAGTQHPWLFRGALLLHPLRTVWYTV